MMKFNLSVYSFMDCDFGVVSKKSLLSQGHKCFSPIFCSRSFMVFGMHLGQ